MKIGKIIKLTDEAKKDRDICMSNMEGVILEYHEEWHRYLIRWDNGKRWWEHEETLQEA